MTDTTADYDSYVARQYEAVARVLQHPLLAGIHGQPSPQPEYARLAERAAVDDLGGGVCLVWRLDDIRYLTRHPAVEQGFKFLGSDRPAIPLGLDGERHLDYRRLLNPVFTPTRVAVLADKVRAQADELIDAFISKGHVDAFSEWCEPLPSTIFLSIMGLPMADRDDFLKFKNIALSNHALDASQEERVAFANEAVQWIQDYLNRDLDAREREAQPRDDMIGWLVNSEVDGQRLSRSDLLDVLGVLMLAGLDTVTSSLGCFLHFFACHPMHRAQIVADPDLIPSAVEELMRFESPVAASYRLVREAITLPSGAVLPADTLACVSWAAANLDATAFPDPLTVDLARKHNPHVGFASGPHRCLGSHLARLELQIALRAWHDRIPEYSLAPGETPAFSGNPRAPRPLSLTWG